MYHQYSIAIYPLLRIVKRYNLNATHFFQLCQDYIRHQAVALFDIELCRMDPVNWFMIKAESITFLNQLILEVDMTDNVVGAEFKNQQFVIYGDTNVPNQ